MLYDRLLLRKYIILDMWDFIVISLNIDICGNLYYIWLIKSICINIRYSDDRLKLRKVNNLWYWVSIKIFLNDLIFLNFKIILDVKIVLF